MKVVREQEYQDRCERAIALALRFSQRMSVEGKSWVIDQMVRILADESYDYLVAGHPWDEGVAP
jgi:hypothetical protein